MLKWNRAEHPSRTCYKTSDGHFVIEHDGCRCWTLWDKHDKNRWFKEFCTLKAAKAGAEVRLMDVEV